jgi:misacylated tRNA(Ala) deacylase
MTELLYQTDAYLQQFEAQISTVEESTRAICLNCSAFYPGGGGQPCDLGEIRAGEVTYPVSAVKKQGAETWHTLGGDAPLPAPGTTILGVLDWTRRHQLMRTHTALHILCGCVFRDYGALVTGGNMDPLEGRMDFEFANLRAELVAEIEAAVNREVAAARDVRVNILPRAEAFQIPDLIRTKINLLPEGINEIRTVEIVGLDLQADGGTHVRNTAEVGQIKVVDYKSKGAINKRIYIKIQ